mmetsp:Transcript_15841/g.25772  ORF Transcript_15841/g.25772 Transcript_15841/m.25772 type:complete len:81 (+) Transcript_15841:60-302(+)
MKMFACFHSKGAEEATRRLDRRDSVTTDQVRGLSEDQLKKELVDMLEEHYSSNGEDMPKTMRTANAEQLRRYWNCLREDA